MNWELCKAVDRDPEKVGGKWCFAETRLPVESLFSHLNSGATIDEFVEWFPGVTPEQVREVLEFVRTSLEQPVAA